MSHKYNQYPKKMTKTPEKQNFSHRVSGLKIYWNRVKRKNDHVLRAQFREILGRPSKNTMTGYLDHPGQIRFSVMVAMAKWLSEVFSEKIDPMDLAKMH